MPASPRYDISLISYLVHRAVIMGEVGNKNYFHSVFKCIGKKRDTFKQKNNNNYHYCYCRVQFKRYGIIWSDFSDRLIYSLSVIIRFLFYFFFFTVYRSHCIIQSCFILFFFNIFYAYAKRHAVYHVSYRLEFFPINSFIASRRWRINICISTFQEFFFFIIRFYSLRVP